MKEECDVHGVSPLLCVSVSDRNLRDSLSSVFFRSDDNIAHNTVILCQSGMKKVEKMPVWDLICRPLEYDKQI